MPFRYQQVTVFSLKEVANSIQKTLVTRYSSSFWVKAEMNKLNFYSYSGHCYPDLVEKNEGKVIAQMRAILWKKDFEHINQKFIQILKEPLKDGINILFLAQIQFDGMHGLSLRIVDIDPSFSLGELEKEKKECLDQLQKEGLLFKNKSLKLPLLPQRIAIISVETSKGYADFLKILTTNPDHFQFFHHLFPANLQGEKAVITIKKQLHNIRKCIDFFDIVVIVRGGGGDVGLSAFNDYSLAKEIALFPLPVFTGIGHATNETVVEMIAHRNAITPTEIANILIQKFKKLDIYLNESEQKIIHQLEKKLSLEKNRFQQSRKLLVSLTMGLLAENKNHIFQIITRLSNYSEFLIQQKKENQTEVVKALQKASTQLLDQRASQLDNAAQKLKILDPQNVLKRGFSITFFQGKIIKDASELKEGESIETQLNHGKVKSIVTHTE